MKKNSYSLTLVFAISFSLLFLPKSLLAAESSLSVTCLDSSGNPLKDVKVEIFRMNDQKKKDKKSDNKGIAAFTGLQDGSYRIVGRKEGYVPVLDFVLLEGSPQSKTFNLSAGADKKFYFEDENIMRRAGSLGQLGMQALQENKFADAEKLFQESLELDSSNPQVIYFLAVAYLQQSKFDQGIEMLSRTAELSRILMKLPTPAGSDPNPFEQLYQQAQTALTNMPAIRGSGAMNAKNYAEAAELFAEAIKTQPNNPDLHYNLAYALASDKKFDEAAQAIEKAIQLKPDEKGFIELKDAIQSMKERDILTRAQNLLDEGNALLKNEDASAALKKYEEARSMIPEDKQAPLWEQIGKARGQLNQTDLAMEAFKKALALAPAESAEEYRKTYAQYLTNEKKFEEVLDLYSDPAAAGSQSNDQVMMSLGEGWAKSGNNEAAMLAYNRAIKANPQNAEAHFQLGMLYYFSKENDVLAKELLTKYLEIGKDEAKLGNVKDMLVILENRLKTSSQ